MLELTPLYDLIAIIFPIESMQLRFMQQALVGLLLLSPMTAFMGVQVVNLSMAFFVDAISHSTFAGIALGLIFSINPHWSMPIFGLMVGLTIIATQRRSSLSIDTIIGVFFSGIVAFGLAVVSRDKTQSRNIQSFLYGDILTITDNDIWAMFVLFVFLILFQIMSYNRMLYIAISPSLAKVHRIPVALYQYIYAALLSLVVIFSVRAVGVLLVTALLIVPAATARNFSRSAGSMIWWAMLVSISSSIIGLLISAQDWANTATGATIILVAFVWFIISSLI